MLCHIDIHLNRAYRHTDIHMKQLNNEGFFSLDNLENESDESEDIRVLKATILDLREWNCNKLADLLAKELEELRK
jgi:hypothetical protein